ncbi:MAG: 50S ribosomal protein L25, partial [Patescibacteria group bacterium]
NFTNITNNNIMTKEIKLNAAERLDSDANVNKLRTEGFLPAVIYGSGAINKKLKIIKNDFAKVYNLAGESHLIDLAINDEAPVKVIIKEIQKDNIKDDIIHVDFYKVNMVKKITTEIPLNFIGEAKAVKDLGAILVKNFDSVEVECLPGDLVDKIDVDISNLNNFDEAIKLKDLVLPKGIELVSETNEIVVNVMEQREEVEEATTDESTVAEVADGKKEEEKGEKGEAIPEEQTDAPKKPREEKK